jgi:hypothetical protein
MRRIHHRELLEALGVAGCNPPAHRPTPVMADNRESMVPEMIGKTGDIGSEHVQIVGRHLRRLVAQIVAALIWRNDMVARGRERLDVLEPRSPIFGKTVQQYDKAAVRRTGLGKMQPNPIHRYVLEMKILHSYSFPGSIRDRMDTRLSGSLSFVLAASPPSRRAVTGIASRPAMNDRVVRRRYHFIDLCRRRFALLKVRLYGGEWHSCEHEDGALELGWTFAAECIPCKARQTGLEPLRLVAHAAFESCGPVSLHEIVTAVEQQ